MQNGGYDPEDPNIKVMIELFDMFDKNDDELLEKP